VADFGIAKSVDEVTSDRTLAGQVVGTPRFMAPERLAGLPATVASDTYSAGVLLREVLAGRSDADPDLLAVAERATAPDPSQRFASAAAMAAALDGGSATVVLPTEPAGQLRDTEAIGTVPLAAAGMPTRVDDAPPTRVLAVSGRGHPGRVVAAAIVALVLAGCVAAAAMRGSGGAEPTTREVVATSTPGNTPQTTVPPTSMPSTSTTASTSTSSTSTSTTTTEPVPPPGPKDGPGGKPKKEKGPGKGK
jgi:serine/threonine-protein kinase